MMMGGGGGLWCGDGVGYIMMVMYVSLELVHVKYSKAEAFPSP